MSLGDTSGNPKILLPSPNGSGTFIQFRTEEGMIYGILTAAHVVRWLKFGKNSQGVSIGLSKFQNDSTIACSVTFPFIFHIASSKKFHSDSNEGYRPDIAFVALGLRRFPKHELLEQSKFYDLDSNFEFGYIYDPDIFSAFCRGANEVKSDGHMSMEICFGGGEVIKNDEKANTQYWEIPNTSKESIAGASGAGFWRFHWDKDVLKKSLEGIIISESENYDCIEAMAGSYLYDNFLPSLKKFCHENIKWFS